MSAPAKTAIERDAEAYGNSLAVAAMDSLTPMIARLREEALHPCVDRFAAVLLAWAVSGLDASERPAALRRIADDALTMTQRWTLYRQPPRGNA